MKTPQQSYEALAKALGIPELYLKREDLHPYGSHKGRSIPLMIKQYVKLEDSRQFVISSSGNAALAAIRAALQHNKNNPAKPITLTVYIGKNIDPKKRTRLEKEASSDTSIALKITERPKQSAFQEAKTVGVINLRQSTDDLALLGYAELAKELDTIENLSAIFIATSSGTTAAGIGEAFNTLKNHPELHCVQTTSCHPIVEAFSKKPIVQELSIAGAIVDKIAHRKNQVVELIQESHGSGWIADNAQIKKAMELIATEARIQTTPNGALAVAGLITALSNNWKQDGAVACIIGGQ